MEDLDLIVQDNKLLAEFNYGTTDWDILNIRYSVFSDFLKYHYDWIILMDIVEKIEKVKLQDHKGYSQSVNVNISGNNCIIETSGYTAYTIANVTSETKIESVWMACVEFVKWYNKNK